MRSFPGCVKVRRDFFFPNGRGSSEKSLHVETAYTSFIFEAEGDRPHFQGRGRDCKQRE